MFLRDTEDGLLSYKRSQNIDNDCNKFCYSIARIGVFLAEFWNKQQWISLALSPYDGGKCFSSQKTDRNCSKLYSAIIRRRKDRSGWSKNFIKSFIKSGEKQQQILLFDCNNKMENKKERWDLAEIEILTNLSISLSLSRGILIARKLQQISSWIEIHPNWLQVFVQFWKINKIGKYARNMEKSKSIYNKFPLLFSLMNNGTM